MKLRFPIGSRGLLLAVGLGIGGMAALAANPEGPFLGLNDTAMNKMADTTVKTADHVDRDFVAMMVQQQGAIDLAQAELQYGRNPQLKTIAQEIVADQIQEITLARLALGESPPQSVSSPTQASSGAMQISPAHESDANQTQMRMAPTKLAGAQRP